MKQKGFTVVELMTTFVLISIISVLLIKLTITLKEVYINGDLKTTILTKQGTMTDKIMKDLNTNTLTSITSCGNNCISFNYNNITKNLSIDKQKNIIKYDNYAIKLNNGSLINDLVFSKDDFDYDSIIKITIPITNPLLKGDYGLNIVYQISNTILFDNNIITNFK